MFSINCAIDIVPILCLTNEDEALVYWIFLGRVDVFAVSTMGYEEERLATWIVDGVRRRRRRDSTAGKSSLRAIRTTCDAPDVLGASRHARFRHLFHHPSTWHFTRSRPHASDRKEPLRFERGSIRVSTRVRFGFEPVGKGDRRWALAKSTTNCLPSVTCILDVCVQAGSRTCRRRSA